MLEHASLLHDIGKIGVPDSLLHRPGGLTEPEITVIRQHPEIGYRILHDCPSLRPVANVVRMHHEWHDGQGYPAGLAGEAILVEARIIAVADAFDAMVSKRPYRSEAYTQAEALARLRQGRGSQFDPMLVDRCLEILSESRVGQLPDQSEPEAKSAFEADPEPEDSLLPEGLLSGLPC